MNEPITIESLINQHIHNQLEEKLPRVVSEKLKQIAPPPVWMTEKQLAEYWQLRTPDGESLYIQSASGRRDRRTSTRCHARRWARCAVTTVKLLTVGHGTRPSVKELKRLIGNSTRLKERDKFQPSK